LLLRGEHALQLDAWQSHAEVAPGGRFVVVLTREQPPVLHDLARGTQVTLEGARHLTGWLAR
jgi:hypothetical protein